MVKNIINQGLAALYNPQEIVDLENQYGNTYGIKNSSSGLLSDARHMAAMNNLSNTLSNSGLGIAMGLPSELAGDVAAFGAGLINELPALGRGFNKQNLGEITEDIAANYAGSFGTPNTATARGIYDTVFKGPASTITTDADVRTAANIANNYGTAQAAEVDNIPGVNLNDFAGSVFTDGGTKYQVNDAGTAATVISRDRPTMADIAGMGDLGNPTGDPRVVSEEMGMVGGRPVSTGRPSMADIAGEINENLRDLGNPLGDSRIASEEQGLSGFPGLGQVDPGFQNVLDAREARATQIANQQNPDYGQFFDATPVNKEKRNAFNDLLGILSLAYTGPYQGFVKGANLVNSARTGKFGRMASAAKKGLGSLGTRLGDFRQKTTGYRTQGEYDQARTERQQQNRTDRMIDRISKGKTTRSNPRDAGTTKAQKDAISAAIQDSYRGGGGGGSSGGGKIVCTMMNERYGFGSFRNKIWMKFHEHHGPEYQKGYHAIFLPLVKIAKGEGKINTAVRKVLEHMGRHVTADMFKIMKGKKRDTLGRIYRAIFEPACHIIGKIKSALGRG